jgi:hypothetical protein
MIDIEPSRQLGPTSGQFRPNLTNRLQIRPPFVHHFAVLTRPAFGKVLAHTHDGYFPARHSPNLAYFQRWTVPLPFFRHPPT